jgi:hypothetical protein
MGCAFSVVKTNCLLIMLFWWEKEIHM